MTGIVDSERDIHTFFELSYSNFLVLHRSLMQSMPEEWQHRAVAVFEELRDAFEHIDHLESCTLQARDASGRFTKDPIPHYNRGRTHVDPLLPTTICLRCSMTKGDHIWWGFGDPDNPPDPARFPNAGPADWGFDAKPIYYCRQDPT